MWTQMKRIAAKPTPQRKTIEEREHKIDEANKQEQQLRGSANFRITFIYFVQHDC